MTVHFDSALSAALTIVSTVDLADLAHEVEAGSVPQSKQKRIVLIRDLFGRIHMALGKKAAATSVRRSDLAEKWQQTLGHYAPYAGDEFFFVDELIAPEALWNSQDIVALDKISKDGVPVYLYDRALGGQDWIRAELSGEGTKIQRLIFHGFKGGVGRSSALAMVARRLADAGKRVLVLDLDLESPGLTNILIESERLPEFGLVDFFVESASSNMTIADFLQREGLIYQRSFLSDGTPGEIFVVPVHGANAGDYIAKLSRTYVEIPGDGENKTKGFAERLHEFLSAIEEKLQPDVVLLDSRAGVDDIAAAIIGRFGAHTLLFGTNSVQTWAGYRLLFEHLKKRRPRIDPQDVFKVVATLIPETEQEPYLDLFKERAYEAFSNSLYEEIQGGHLNDGNFSVNSEDAPHFPLEVFWRREYMEFDPVKNARLFDPKQADAVYGELLEYVVEFVGSGRRVTHGSN